MARVRCCGSRYPGVNKPANRKDPALGKVERSHHQGAAVNPDCRKKNLKRGVENAGLRQTSMNQHAAWLSAKSLARKSVRTVQIARRNKKHELCAGPGGRAQIEWGGLEVNCAKLTELLGARTTWFISRRKCCNTR